METMTSIFFDKKILGNFLKERNAVCASFATLMNANVERGIFTSLRKCNHLEERRLHDLIQEIGTVSQGGKIERS